jgi:hypothetical protein
VRSLIGKQVEKGDWGWKWNVRELEMDFRRVGGISGGMGRVVDGMKIAGSIEDSWRLSRLPASSGTNGSPSSVYLSKSPSFLSLNKLQSPRNLIKVP